MNVRVSDRFEVKGDATQWQVVELKEVEDKETGAVEQKWVPLQSFHGRIEYALKWIEGYAPRAERKELSETVGEFLTGLEKLDKDIAKHGRQFDKRAKEVLALKLKGSDVDMAAQLKAMYECLSAFNEAKLPPDDHAVEIWKSKLQELGILEGE